MEFLRRNVIRQATQAAHINSWNKIKVIHLLAVLFLGYRIDIVRSYGYKRMAGGYWQKYTILPTTYLCTICEKYFILPWLVWLQWLQLGAYKNIYITRNVAQEWVASSEEKYFMSVIDDNLMILDRPDAIWLFPRWLLGDKNVFTSLDYVIFCGMPMCVGASDIFFQF